MKPWKRIIKKLTTPLRSPGRLENESLEDYQLRYTNWLVASANGAQHALWQRVARANTLKGLEVPKNPEEINAV